MKRSVMVEDAKGAGQEGREIHPLLLEDGLDYFKAVFARGESYRDGGK